MEYVNCPHCGNETPAALSRCKHCGERRDKSHDIFADNGKTDSGNAYEPVARERYGFVSFWLWACYIINIIMTVVYLALIFSDTGMGSIRHPEPMFTRIASFLLSIVVVFAYWQLLTWKKIGYYLIVATATINALINLSIAPSAFVIFSAVTPLVVLYLVLQITKDGVSCWSQLS